MRLRQAMSNILRSWTGTERAVRAYRRMSTRGINFLYKWMDEHIPAHATADPGLITDLADHAMADAAKAGIQPHEIDEEVDSVFAVMAEAVSNQEGGAVE